MLFDSIIKWQLLPPPHHLYCMPQLITITYLATWWRHLLGRTPGSHSTRLSCCQTSPCWSRRRVAGELRVEMVIKYTWIFNPTHITPPTSLTNRVHPCSRHGWRYETVPGQLYPISAIWRVSGPRLLFCSAIGQRGRTKVRIWLNLLLAGGVSSQLVAWESKRAMGSN